MPVNLGSAEGYIDLDFSSLLKGVDSSLSAIKKLDSAYTESESQLRKMESQLKTSGSAFQAAAQQSQRLSLELESAKKKADTYRKAIEGMETASKNAANEQAQLKSKIEAADARLEKAEQKVKSLSDAYKAASQATKDAADAYGKESKEAQKAAAAEEELKIQLEKATEKANAYRNELLQLQTKHQKLGQDMETAREKTAGFRTELNNTEAKINDLTRELAEAESVLLNMGTSMEKVGGKFKSAGEKIDRVGSALSLGVTAPLVGIGTAAVNAGNDFEAQMSRVSAIADAYGDELEQLREQAIELGASTSFSATGAAEAMENLASAGFKTQEIMEAMPGMLDLAASSGEDLATSADIAASTLRGFQLNASDAAHVADVLAKNAADTNAAIVDTGYAMKYIAPVAASVGWSLEEVTAAIGKMADAGIKGEQAGTTLRGALTRLMKPTDDMYAVMEDLGISFYDAQGKMKPLSTIIDDLQKSMKGLTDEQRDNNLAYLFGTEALSGMKVLLASSKEELDQMTEGLENADGAAKKMADTMLDNTKGSIEEMNGSLETAGITIQKQLAPWITKGAEKVTELANEFANLDENTQGSILTMAGIAAASGPVVKVLGKVTGGVGDLITNTGGLIKDLGKLSSAKKAAEAIGSIGTFSTKSVEGVSGLSKVLFKLGSPAGIAVMATTAAVGLGVGIYSAMQQAKQAAIDADLEKRFGDISLSMEEVEDIATQLTTNDWTMQVDAVIEAKGKLDELKEQVQTSVDEINKLGWKINVGLGLSEEENETFRSSMDSFVNDSIDYIQQKQYTASLAVDAIMTPGSKSYENVRNFVDEFYSGSQKEMQELGDTMAAEVDKALADGVITEDEYLNIQSIQAKLQELINQTENAQYQAKIKSMQMQVEGGSLSADSFKNIMDTAGEQLQKQIDAADQAFLEAVTPLQLQLENEEISEAQYESCLRDAQEGLNRKKGELVLENVTVGIETIQSNYGDKLEEWQEEFSDTVARTITDGYDGASGKISYLHLYEAISDDFDAISDEATAGARELMDSMQPQTKQLEEVAQAYFDAGKIPPENIRKGLEDNYELQMMAGNMDYLYKYLTSQIADSPELQEAIKVSAENGAMIPQELAEGLKDMYGLELVERNGKFMWKTLDNQAQSSAEVMQDTFREYGLSLPDSLAEGLDAKSASLITATMTLLENLNKGKQLKEAELQSVFSTLGIALPDALMSSLAGKNAEVQAQTLQLLANVEGAVPLKEEDLTTLFSNLGIKVPDTLIEAMASKEADVQGKALELLTQLQNADEEKRPEILAQMLDLGQEVDANLCSGIASKLSLVKDEATGMISVIDTTTGTEITKITPTFARRLGEMGAEGFEAMEDEIGDKELDAPDVGEISTQSVKDWRRNAQGYLDDHKLEAKFKPLPSGVSGPWLGGNLPRNADGGIIRNQTISWLAEGDKPEAVIPLSAEKRARGLELWRQAGEELGAMDAARDVLRSTPSGSSSGGYDYRRLAAAVAAELRRAPIEVKPEFYVSSGDVYLEGEPVGRSLAPVIDSQLSRLQERRKRGG